MKRAGLNFSLATLILFSLPRVVPAQTETLPKFDEVYQLLLKNSSGLKESELNRAAVKGLLNELQTRAVLVTDTAKNGTGSNSNSISQISSFENAFGYFRVNKVESGLNDSFKDGYKKLLSTNKLKGLVVDLRYAGGTDYGVAAKIADLFIKTEQPLLQWGEASARSTKKTNAITFPVAILVNHQTSGAAEALAGMLRQAQIGLIIGTNTAGQASVFKDFPLSTGQQIKIASAPVKLGNGEEIPSSGLSPDIEVVLSAEEQKEFYKDPYRQVKDLSASVGDTNGATASSPTNRPRRRLNEAELVRLQREGISPDQEFFDQATRSLEPSEPVVSDPALVRALDLLKGLAVFQQNRRN